MNTITECWLKEQNACKESYSWLRKQKNKDWRHIAHKLYSENRLEWCLWLLYRKSYKVKLSTYFYSIISLVFITISFSMILTGVKEVDLGADFFFVVNHLVGGAVAAIIALMGAAVAATIALAGAARVLAAMAGMAAVAAGVAAVVTAMASVPEVAVVATGLAGVAVMAAGAAIAAAIVAAANNATFFLRIHCKLALPNKEV